MSGDWPADPGDPRCPECDEPVSATADYCLHCYADLPAAGGEPAEATTMSADPSAAGPTPGGAGRATPSAEPPEGMRGWLHPDSAFDDVSTAGVGLVGGFLDGFVLFLLVLWVLPRDVQSSGALAAGVAGWLLATGWMTWTRTVFGALRKAGYSFALLVALVPPAVAVALRDPGALVFGVVLWPVAAIVAGAGWFAGRGAVDGAD